MPSQNVTKKNDQLIMYVCKLLNRVQQNYNKTKREVLTMIFTLHKFKHYLLSNKLFFYVDHMALVYLVNKPQVLRKIVRWLLLFLKYDFTIVYKPGKTHIIANALSRLLNMIDSIGVPNQTTYVNMFYTKLE
jgi:hypothetical protein